MPFYSFLLPQVQVAWLCREKSFLLPHHQQRRLLPRRFSETRAPRRRRRNQNPNPKDINQNSAPTDGAADSLAVQKLRLQFGETPGPYAAPLGMRSFKKKISTVLRTMELSRFTCSSEIKASFGETEAVDNFLFEDKIFQPP
jgi:hypothetical protein